MSFPTYAPAKRALSEIAISTKRLPCRAAATPPPLEACTPTVTGEVSLGERAVERGAVELMAAAAAEVTGWQLGRAVWRWGRVCSRHWRGRAHSQVAEAALLVVVEIEVPLPATTQAAAEQWGSPPWAKSA